MGTWNERRLNKGNLNIVKDEMNGVQVLGISKLIGIGHFQLEGHNVCSRSEKYRRNNDAFIIKHSVAFIIRKECLGIIQSMTKQYQLMFVDNPLITFIKVYAPTTIVEEDSKKFYG